MPFVFSLRTWAENLSKERRLKGPRRAEKERLLAAAQPERAGSVA
ncbi:MAG TPA: hypothetical protein VHR45_22510 [Thermoanaerobaculia bacterium]|nr:hypothetical protein [Thermoanaerobaculia bacterium]